MYPIITRGVPAVISAGKAAKKLYDSTKRKPHGGRTPKTRQEIEDEMFPKIQEQLNTISRTTGKPVPELPTGQQVSTSLQRYIPPRHAGRSAEKGN